MAVIQPHAPVCTVIVTLTCAPADMEELAALATAAAPIFARQPGFISSSLHRASDDTRLLQYLQWRSLDDSNACMMSPDWQAEAGQRFMAFMQTGKVTMEPVVYQVIAAQGA